ncbi:Ion channel [Palleronia marisminoris]|uniref:Bacterial extracellular solute-binding proteins, family 3 n=1 Tax=Palleronia marisminoris TaxID=315423 RepID=A0A1Y5RBM0_9RHOB|nr:ion channel [Palleronia marisminoris]SFG11325.1 Ion channel [Palleronia marisminoris]SLN13663.1 Bacterial extracellular solute-binding proteins, family 3 [Palleronia marisminoris]
MRYLAVALFAAFLPLSLAAQDAATVVPKGESGPLRVGVADLPPYAIDAGEGAWLGMGVDIWRLVAEREGWAYELISAGPDELEAGSVDLLLPVVASPTLEARVDLSLPFHVATMGVAAERESRLLSVMRGFLSWRFLQLVVSLSALLLAIGALIWVVERRRNQDEFNPGILKGLGDGFWWAGVTLTTIGYGDKSPKTLLGRLVAMLWMLTGLAVSAALTATVVTLAQPGRSGSLPERFAGETVSVVADTPTARFLDSAGVSTAPRPDMDGILNALESGDVTRAAAPAPVLRHAISERGAVDYGVSTTTLHPLMIAVALAEGSDLREPVNRALLEVLSTEAGWDVLQRYDQIEK